MGIDKEAQILILGSGKGNLDRLLLENGFKNIVSIDINEKDYHVKGTKFYRFDLNKDFTWDSTKYDLIVAVEIIEHIESIAHFIREISKKLNQKVTQ